MSVNIQVYLLGQENGVSTFSKGKTLRFESVATDDASELRSHWLIISNSQARKGWSFSQGNLGNNTGAGTISIKQGSFTFEEPGSYQLTAVCDTNSAPDSWVISAIIDLSIVDGIIPGTGTTTNPGGATDAGNGPPVVVVDPPPPPPIDNGPPSYDPPPVIPSGPILDVPAAYRSGPIPFALLGDSLYFNKSGQGNPADLVAAAATSALGDTCTLALNASVDGASSRYIVQTSGLLASTCAAIKASGAKVTLVRFGHNDSKTTVAVPASEFKTNMLAIANALVTDAEQEVVIVNYPIGIQVDSYNGLWNRSSLDLLDSYLPMCDQVCNQTTIRQGNRSLYVHFQNHRDQTFDGVHPYYEGIQALATGDAMGMKYALRPIASMPIIQNGDGSVNAAGYTAFWKTEDPRAWSRYWGPTWQEKHPSGVEDRDELYTKELKYDSQLYDRLGEGIPIPPIDGSLQNPGHDMHPVGCSQQVIPRTDGPTHPAVDPGVNNYFFGLPNYCTDPNDPANDNPDPAIRVLLMLDHRQRTVRLNDDYWMSLQGGDYNSDGGTIIYHGEDRINFCQVDRFQGSAQYNLCFAFEPKRNEGPPNRGDIGYDQYGPLYLRGDFYGATGQPLANALGRLPSNPIWAHRANFINSSEAWIEDAYGAGTTQPGDTSRDGDAYPLPAVAFPVGDQPGPFCISTMNEFKANIIWDTSRHVGKIRLYAMQGYALKNHSPRFYGLSNEGSWSGCRFIDEFDIVDEHGVPMKFPTSICMGTDATLKPTNPDPGQINLADEGQRAGYRNSSLDNSGNYSSFAKSGFIAVASKTENKVIVFDCKAYIEDLWNSYMEADQTTWLATIAEMDAGTFPKGWSGGRASLKPTPVYSATVTKPTCMLASGGLTSSHFGDWSGDFEKLLVATESGLCHVISIAPFMDRFHFGYWWNLPVQIYGSFQIGSEGSNPTELIWSRFVSSYNDVKSATVNGQSVMDEGQTPNPFGQTFFACCRADRAVYGMVTRFAGNRGVIGASFSKITDKRIQDPVTICVATRNLVLHIGDYSRCMLHGIMFGGAYRAPVYDSSRGVTVYSGFYSPPDPTGNRGWSYAGGLRVGGSPFRISLDNINTLISMVSVGLSAALAILHGLTIFT